MTTEERASKLLTDLEAVCNDYAGTEQGCKLKELFIAALADASRAALIWAAAEIVREHRMDDRDGWLDLATKIRQRASEGV